VTFLHEAYLEREPDPVRTFEPYERFEASNAIIDEFASLRAELDEEGFIRAVVVLPDGEEVPLTIETSRLLFGVDREAYKFAGQLRFSTRVRGLEHTLHDRRRDA
jgi:hypothetical protein